MAGTDLAGAAIIAGTVTCAFAAVDLTAGSVAAAIRGIDGAIGGTIAYASVRWKSAKIDRLRKRPGLLTGRDGFWRCRQPP